MLAALLDHLWQSTGFFAAACVLAVLTRRNAAIIRLWIWRIAALKFLIPFGALFALGTWLGYPVVTPDVPAPAPLIQALRFWMPLVAPAQSHSVGMTLLLAGLLAGVLAAAAGLRWTLQRIGQEYAGLHCEHSRLERDPDDAPPSLGFFKAVLLTLLGLSTVGVPLIGGAVQDRLQRRNLLITDSLALRSATIHMTPAKPGMGNRVRVVAHTRGVVIRNANIQYLVGVVHGVSPYSVWTNQMAVDTEHFWLTAPRYDVVVHGAIRDPHKFELYALRQPITKLLAERFGLEIYQDGKCQPPCGRYGVAMPAEPL